MPIANDYKLTVTASGGAGTSTGSGETVEVVRGYIEAIHLEFSAGAAGTTDITIENSHPPKQTLLQLTNFNTDGWHYTRATLTAFDDSGITNAYDRFLINDHVTVSLSEANDGDSVNVTFIVGER